jgi:hypothetical protein
MERNSLRAEGTELSSSHYEPNSPPRLQDPSDTTVYPQPRYQNLFYYNRVPRRKPLPSAHNFIYLSQRDLDSEQFGSCGTEERTPEPLAVSTSFHVLL